MRSAFIVLFLVAGVQNAATASSEALIGDWYTEGVEHGIHVQSIIHNLGDGTFTKDLHIVTACDAANNSVETGSWSFDGKTYAEITKSVDGMAQDSNAPDMNDTFDYANIDNEHITLHDPKTNITWMFTRVSPDYHMPPASGCTV